MNLIVLSPHRDDAAFSVGLAMEAWAAAGHLVSVLNCFTQSTYAPYSDAEALHANDRLSYVSAIRKREDLAWQKLGKGRWTFHDLDLLDAPLRLACEVNEVLMSEIRPGDRAVARVRGAIEKIAHKSGDRPTAFVAPLAVGSHIDHQVTRRAVCEVAAQLDLCLAFYEDLPYAAREDAAASLPALASSIELSLQPAFAAPPDQDSDEAARRKAAMADCYDSQIDSSIVVQIADFSKRYGGRERLWATPAWMTNGPQVFGEAEAS